MIISKWTWRKTKHHHLCIHILDYDMKLFTLRQNKNIWTRDTMGDRQREKQIQKICEKNHFITNWTDLSVLHYVIINCLILGYASCIRETPPNTTKLEIWMGIERWIYVWVEYGCERSWLVFFKHIKLHKQQKLIPNPYSVCLWVPISSIFWNIIWGSLKYYFKCRWPHQDGVFIIILFHIFDLTVHFFKLFFGSFFEFLTSLKIHFSCDNYFY